MADFTEDEISKFHFLQDLHPAQFALYKADMDGTPVSVLCWVDMENEAVRPMMIVLNDELMESLTFKDAVLRKEN